MEGCKVLRSVHATVDMAWSSSDDNAIRYVFPVCELQHVLNNATNTDTGLEFLTVTCHVASLHCSLQGKVCYRRLPKQ